MTTLTLSLLLAIFVISTILLMVKDIDHTIRRIKQNAP